MVMRGVVSVDMMVTGGEIKVVMIVKRAMIEVLMMEDVDICLNRLPNIPLAIWKDRLMVILEVDI